MNQGGMNQGGSWVGLVVGSRRFATANRLESLPRLGFARLLKKLQLFQKPKKR